jgi:uncharacterized protein HemX
MLPMAERKKSRTAGMSMRPVSLGRRSKPKAEKPTKEAKTATKATATKAKPKKGSKEPAATKSSAQARARSSAGKSTKKTPAPNMQERMEGLQGWMAEIERKQNRMSRLGGGAAILAVLAAGGALALGILNKQDAATEDDLDEVREQVNGISGTVEQQTEQQLGNLNKTLNSLRAQIQSLQQQQQQQTQTINQLQNQVNSAAAAPSPAVPPTTGGGGSTP